MGRLYSYGIGDGTKATGVLRLCPKHSDYRSRQVA